MGTCHSAPIHSDDLQKQKDGSQRFKRFRRGGRNPADSMFAAVKQASFKKGDPFGRLPSNAGTAYSKQGSLKQVEAVATADAATTRIKKQKGAADGSAGKYVYVKDLLASRGCQMKLMRIRSTKELVAVKFIPRDAGNGLDVNTEREIVNHRKLLHPNILRFKEVYFTNDFLCIAIEYAPNGPLFDLVAAAGRFSEDQARWFFRQLVSGVSYCHSHNIQHRALKLENLLLDGNDNLKISEFGYSKNSMFDSQPKTAIGSPAYTPPEVLMGQIQGTKYDGEIMDAWSCGVILYVMLVGTYPFEDPENPRSFRSSLQRIMKVQYSFPAELNLSGEVVDLLGRIFQRDPAQRITIEEIKSHPWMLPGAASQMAGLDSAMSLYGKQLQSEEEVQALMRRLAAEATPPEQFNNLNWGEDDN